MDQVDRLLTVNELAGYLVVPPATTNGWCHRSVWSHWSDLERWSDAQLTASSPAVSAR